ncbi:hypothetical protein [Alcaligenes sp. Marseille-Q7550]
MTVTSNFNPGIQATASYFSAEMSIETALLVVQSKRVELTDQQLRTEIEGMQKRNEKIAVYNEVLNKLNVFQGAIKGTNSDAKIPNWNGEQARRYEIPLNDAIKAAGLENELSFKGTGERTPVSGETADGDNGIKVAGISVDKNTNKGQIDAAIAKIKSLIDAAGNQQQMDMLRVQNMNGKRNEAFDLMSNFIKTVRDSKQGMINKM